MTELRPLIERLDLAKQLATDGASVEEIMSQASVTDATAKNYISRFGHAPVSFDGLTRTIVENPEWLRNCKKVLTSKEDDSDVE